MSFLDSLEMLRDETGLRKVELAKLAKVSADTVARAEKHIKCSRESLTKIVNALNEYHYKKAGNLLDARSLITETSNFVKGRSSKINAGNDTDTNKDGKSQVIPFGKSDV